MGISLVTGSGLTTESNIDTVNKAETEMETDMETAAMGPLALYHWKMVVVLMQTDLQEGLAGGGIHLAGGGANHQGGKRLPCNWPGGGGVEGGDNHSKFTPRHLH